MKKRALRPPGRPSKFTPARTARIIALVRAGNYAEVAARQAGIHSSTYFDWMARGKMGEKGYHEFSEAIGSAEAFAESQAVVLVRKEMATNWKAAGWYLERKFHDRWGRKYEHSGPKGGPIPLSVVPDAELDARIRDLEQQLKSS